MNTVSTPVRERSYPGVPTELDKRRKLTPEQIDEIRRLYTTGKWTHRTLGTEFGVSKTMIRYYLIDEDMRKELNQKRYARIADLVSTDPDYAEKRRVQKIKNTVDLMKRTEELKDWKGKQTYKWKKKNYHTNTEFREKTKLQSRESYYRKQEVL